MQSFETSAEPSFGAKLAERAETLTASLVDLILDDEGADYFGH